MKILLLQIVATFVFPNYLYAQPKTNLYSKYSITNMGITNVSVVKESALGNTVEHYTAYTNENEYAIRIMVHRNEVTNIPDFTLTVECFFSEQLVTLIDVNMNKVEWISEDNFSYSFSLAVEKSGWVYFCISTPTEISQESRIDRYHQLRLHAGNKLLYLSSLKK